MFWGAFTLILGVLVSIGLFVTTYKFGRDGYGVNGFGVTLSLVGGIVCVIAIGFGIGFMVSDVACERFGDRTGRPVEWAPVGGCYVEVDGRYVPEGWIVPVVEGERLRIEIELPEE